MSFSPEAILFAGRAVLLVVAFVVAAIAFTRWRHEAERDSRLTAERAQWVLDRLAAIDARLNTLDQRLADLTRQLEERAQPAATAATSPSYPIAIRLARSGASREELMESCGITAQEAELLRRLHGPAKRPRGGQFAAA